MECENSVTDLSFVGTEKRVSDLVKNYRPLRQPKKKEPEKPKKKGFLAQAAENLFAQRHMPPPESHPSNPRLL